MPELPDVETYQRYLDATVLHQSIDKVSVESERILANLSTRTLQRRLQGQAFQQTRRHGKYLFIELDSKEWLVLHFGMTGRPQYLRQEQDVPDHTCLLITFRDGSRFAYITQRKLGHVHIVDAPEAIIREHRLGPDALDLEFEDFQALASNRRGTVKSWLMNQSVMAGIGNVYSDEILYQAGIHPKKQVSQLDDDELDQLFHKMREVLMQTIEVGADPNNMPRSYLLPNRESNACPRCGAELQKTSISSRSAIYCPRCQPEPGPKH